MENVANATQNNITAAQNGVMTGGAEETAIARNGETVTENADFHTVSEFMEGIAEGEENGTDHTIHNNEQEEKNADEFNAEGDATMGAVMQIPQSKLEEIAGWCLYFAVQEGILQYQTIAAGNTLDTK